MKREYKLDEGFAYRFETENEYHNRLAQSDMLWLCKRGIKKNIKMTASFASTQICILLKAAEVVSHEKYTWLDWLESKTTKS